MNQEQRDAIKLAGQTKYPSKGYEAAVKRLHFSWGCTHVINHAAQFGLVDSIKADTVLHVGLAQLEAENTRYREALEDVDIALKNEGFINSTGEGVGEAVRIVREALKQ